MQAKKAGVSVALHRPPKLSLLTAAMKHAPPAAAACACLTQVVFSCGADLLESFMHMKEDGAPLWSFADQEAILGNGLAVAHRHGTDLEHLCVMPAHLIVVHCTYDMTSVWS